MDKKALETAMKLREAIAPYHGLDNCPKCGRRITDYCDNGMESPMGQRWCVDHFLSEITDPNSTIIFHNEEYWMAAEILEEGVQ